MDEAEARLVRRLMQLPDDVLAFWLSRYMEAVLRRADGDEEWAAKRVTYMLSRLEAIDFEDSMEGRRAIRPPWWERLFMWFGRA